MKNINLLQKHKHFSVWEAKSMQKKQLNLAALFTSAVKKEWPLTSLALFSIPSELNLT